MKNLSRSNGLKIAGALLFAIAFTGIVVFGIPFLTGSRAGAEGSPTLGIVIFSFAVDSLTMVVAYAVWRAERWGVITAIIISVFNSILNMGGALLDPGMASRAVAAAIFVASLCVIYLCLRQDRQALTRPAGD